MPWPIKKGTYAFIVLHLFFVLTARSCSSEFFSLVFYMTVVAGICVFKFKHRDSILKDNE